MSEDRNLILAIVLCTLVIIGWQFVFPTPEPVKNTGQTAQQQTDSLNPADQGTPTPQSPDLTPNLGGASPAPAVQSSTMSRDQALASTQRVAIDAPRLSGSIALTGGVIDDIQLKDYRETVDEDSPQINLLLPKGTDHAYFGAFGWFDTNRTGAKLPGLKTQWTQVGTNALAPETPVKLTWDNGENLKFSRTIAIDDNYMMTITDKVENGGADAVQLAPYGQIVRYSMPENLQNFFVLHEGFVGVNDGTLKEAKYKKIIKEGNMKLSSTGGWIGITDKYWLTAIIPPQDEQFNGAYKYYPATPSSPEIFTADYLLGNRQVDAGSSQQVTRRFFAGAKEVDILSMYQKKGADRFDLAIDWGWFFFLTRPFFWMLHHIGEVVGNVGVAILILTVLIKLAFFPLANQSYVAMSKMKQVQPEMMKIRDRFKDDRVKQNQELMELYKREKVNPMAGCLPMLIQIPVFFALYKVLFVTIEMRQQPFFGWIQDLSLQDPTNIFNLFGLIPWTPPEWLPVLGVWPLIMGVTMYLQTKLNPAPQDPVQEKIFALMPIMFTFILASFPAGLVIYWAWNNTLSIIQQYTIMRRMGVEVNIADRVSVFSFVKSLTGSSKKAKNPDTSQKTAPAAAPKVTAQNAAGTAGGANGAASAPDDSADATPANGDGVQSEQSDGTSDTKPSA